MCVWNFIKIILLLLNKIFLQLHALLRVQHGRQRESEELCEPRVKILRPIAFHPIIVRRRQRCKKDLLNIILSCPIIIISSDFWVVEYPYTNTNTQIRCNKLITFSMYQSAWTFQGTRVNIFVYIYLCTKFNSSTTSILLRMFTFLQYIKCRRLSHSQTPFMSGFTNMSQVLSSLFALVIAEFHH